MKRVAVIFICLLFFGCNFTFLNTSPGDNICLQKPPEAKSWLCEASAAAGVTLDTVDGLLLDGTAIGVIVADVDIKRIGSFLDKVDRYLNLATIENLTYTIFFNRLNEDAAKVEVIKAMLNRRLAIFKNNEIISAWDLYVLRLAVQHQREQFGLK